MELVLGVLRDRYVLDLGRAGVLSTAQGGVVPELIRAYCSYLGLCVARDRARTPSLALGPR